MLEVIGIAASEGIAIAKAFCLVEPDLTFEKVRVTETDAEISRFNRAIEAVKKELSAIREKTKESLGEEKAAIFSAQLLILEDPEFLTAIAAKIKDNINAELALQEVSQSYIEFFQAMDNEYMRERSSDIKDVSKRLLAQLLQVQLPDLNSISSEVILVAEDLTPSMTAQLDTKYVKGFIMDVGGKTSHSAILARVLGIPAVVGTKEATKCITHESSIILDGTAGKVVIEASEEEIGHYQQLIAVEEREAEELNEFSTIPSTTADGYSIEISGNIGKSEDVDLVLANGGDGIGLFRTEFLYMDADNYPTEEEQFDAYRSVLSKMGEKPVVIRTLDIGGDKELPYLNMPDEMNPFLGYRAIRLCLDQPNLFRTQLRALLRASTYGNLKIMFPMITTIEEFREAKAILLEEKQRLFEDGVEVSEQIEIGMMVEVPSAAIIADLFAQEADFLSIGTNDLIQYTMAADRMNETVSYLYQPCHPAILRLIKMVIDAGHANGRWVGMCGEMAGEEAAIPILVGMGLNEFSMSSSSILKARKQIFSLSKDKLSVHIDTILTLKTSQEVIKYLKKNLQW